MRWNTVSCVLNIVYTNYTLASDFSLLKMQISWLSYAKMDHFMLRLSKCIALLHAVISCDSYPAKGNFITLSVGLDSNL